MTRLSRGMIAAVRVRMARRGLDQRTLARETGMSEAYLSRRLQGLAAFTMVDVENLAAALSVSPDRLVGEALAEMELLGQDDAPA